MKQVIFWFGAILLLGTAGCEVEGGYGGAYAGVSGEYPAAGYGEAVYPGYVGPYRYGRGAYDRDHYWDRDRYWERHRWHGDGGWGHHYH